MRFLVRGGLLLGKAPLRHKLYGELHERKSQLPMNSVDPPEARRFPRLEVQAVF